MAEEELSKAVIKSQSKLNALILQYNFQSIIKSSLSIAYGSDFIASIARWKGSNKSSSYLINHTLGYNHVRPHHPDYSCAAALTSRDLCEGGLCAVVRQQGHSGVITQSNCDCESIINQCNLCCGVTASGAAGMGSQKINIFLEAYCALNSKVWQWGHQLVQFQCGRCRWWFCSTKKTNTWK